MFVGQLAISKLAMELVVDVFPNVVGIIGMTKYAKKHAMFKIASGIKDIVGIVHLDAQNRNMVNANGNA